jgi:hypothetical protein
MIMASRFLLCSKDSEAGRAFFLDPPGIPLRRCWRGLAHLRHAAGRRRAFIRWRVSFHSACGISAEGASLYLLCDDLGEQIEFLGGRNVYCTAAQAAPCGRTTAIPLPSGGHIGLYQPLHTTA